MGCREVIFLFSPNLVRTLTIYVTEMALIPTTLEALLSFWNLLPPTGRHGKAKSKRGNKRSLDLPRKISISLSTPHFTRDANSGDI
jgi:hypothetical protein